jgi:hypothetical protein
MMIKISELLEKLYNGSILSDTEYNKYLLMVASYKAKEQKQAKFIKVKK